MMDNANETVDCLSNAQLQLWNSFFETSNDLRSRKGSNLKLQEETDVYLKLEYYSTEINSQNTKKNIMVNRVSSSFPKKWSLSNSNRSKII